MAKGCPHGRTAGGPPGPGALGEDLCCCSCLGAATRSRIRTPEPWLAAVRQLQRLDRLAGLLVYGSPYLWEQLQAFWIRDPSGLQPWSDACSRRHCHEPLKG